MGNLRDPAAFNTPAPNGGTISAADMSRSKMVQNVTNITTHATGLIGHSDPILALAFGGVTLVAVLLNLLVLCYILHRRLYRNFVSSHFIAHLIVTSLVTCFYPIPVFIWTVFNGSDPFVRSELACRFHAFAYCTLWTVVYFMIAAIAGIHYITFARIHYEQLFGLSPTVICGLAWLAAAALGLPCLTNRSIVGFDLRYFHCLWLNGTMSYKFLAYMILLGVIIPVALTFYCYIRILAIFYHSPVVFQALGLFRARYLLFLLLLNAVIQVPFFVYLFVDWSMLDKAQMNILQPILLFCAFGQSLTSGALYGPSLFLIKEEDIALTHRPPPQQANKMQMPPGTTGKLLQQL